MNRPEMCTGLPYNQYNVVDLTTADASIGGMSATGQTVMTNTGANSCQNAFAIGQDFEAFANKTASIRHEHSHLTDLFRGEYWMGCSESGTNNIVRVGFLRQLRFDIGVG